ncbi:MAG: hypothetical protein AAFP84_06180 [Actinomycetota bacterium]
MGHQLIFWREGGDTPSAASVYSSLMEGSRTAGLTDLPIDRIIDRFAVAFEGIDRPLPFEPTGPIFWEDPASVTSLQVWWTSTHVGVELRPVGLFSHDVANRVIDLMREFDCPLYDPQVDQRFSA